MLRTSSISPKLSYYEHEVVCGTFSFFNGCSIWNDFSYFTHDIGNLCSTFVSFAADCHGSSLLALAVSNSLSGQGRADTLVQEEKKTSPAGPPASLLLVPLLHFSISAYKKKKKASGSERKDSTSSYFLAGFSVGPLCLRFSETLPLDPGGIYWLNFCCLL